MVDFAVYSNTGSREINEDYVSVYSDGDRFCFVLADGLGGEGSGDMASRFVCNHTVTLAEKGSRLDDVFLETCFTVIHTNLMKAKKELFITSGMTSTLSILVFDGDTANWGHIGDTRIYNFDGTGLVGVTTDHSLAQFMMSSGISNETDVRNHPDRSTLMAAMGMPDMQDAYEIDTENVKLDKPMSFLLCTDGFWQYVLENELNEIVSENLSAEKTVNALVARAEKNAGDDDRDNISLIFVRYTPD